MKVFIRYIRRNMLEKKGRLALLIFSIMLSCALMIVSLGLIDVIFDSFTAPLKKAACGKDICITSSTEEPFFKASDVNEKGIKDLEGELDMTGVIEDEDEMIYANLRGKEELNMDMIKGEFNSSKDKTCVISKRIADENSLEVGDYLEVIVAGSKERIKVSGIATTDGIFYNDNKNTFTVVVSYKYLDNLIGADGKYNMMTATFAKSAESKKERTDSLKEFNKANENVIASDIAYMDAGDTGMIQTVLYIMLGIVCVVCVLIIRGVFKLIITERIQTIGTFMSQGATKRKIQNMLLVESLLYALVSCVVGTLVGIGGIAILTRVLSPFAKYGIYNEVKINPVHILIGCVFAVILSLFSAWAPIRKVKKLQVKEVILNRVEVHEKTGILTRIITGIGIKLFKNKPTLFLSFNNIRSSKLLRNNMVLLAFSLAAVLSIVSASKSMTDVVVGAYNDMDYDYTITNIISSNAKDTTTDSIIKELKADKNVKNDSINPTYYGYGNLDEFELAVCGVNAQAFQKYIKNYIDFSKEPLKSDYEKFINSSDKEVVISTVGADKINKKVGDTVKISINEKTEEFKIAAIADFKLYNSGSMCLIDQSYIKEIFGIREASEITYDTVKANADTYKKYKKLAKNYGATLSSIEEDKQQNVENNAIVMKAFSVFAYIALGVAAIGIFNNITICFMQRKREFAVMTSVGMNKNMRRKLILAENTICALVSILVAVPLGKLFNQGIEVLLKSMGTPMDVYYDIRGILVYGLLVVGIVIVASLSALKKSKKMSVIAELKYE